jgi:hypothetical protein
VLDQNTRRARARGPAVRLVAGRSTVVSGQRGGKRLTAKLTLRIAKRYAGRTLVAKLAARDDNGARQHIVGRTDQRAAPFALRASTSTAAPLTPARDEHRTCESDRGSRSLVAQSGALLGRSVHAREHIARVPDPRGSGSALRPGTLAQLHGRQTR